MSGIGDRELRDVIYDRRKAVGDGLERKGEERVKSPNPARLRSMGEPDSLVSNTGTTAY